VTISRTDRTTWPEVLRRADLAVIYGVTPKCIDDMRLRGELPARLPGGDPLWSKTDLCRWLDVPNERRGLRRTA
jgi:hypothetical protein